MKKRLLSAALALAMMLTLLPLSVFAVDGGTTSSAKITITTSLTEPTDGWKSGDTVNFTSNGEKKLNLNLTYGDGSVSGDTAVIPQAVRVVADSGDTATESTTVNEAVYFAGSSSWTPSSRCTGLDNYSFSSFDGKTLVLTGSSTPISASQLGTVTVTAERKAEGGSTSWSNTNTVSAANVSSVNSSGQEVITSSSSTPSTSAGTLNNDNGGKGVSVTRCTAAFGNVKYGQWYHQEGSGASAVYTVPNSGVVVNGKWYNNIPTTVSNNVTRYSTDTVTLVGDSISLNAAHLPTSMTIELDGHNVIISKDIPLTTTSLTINNNLQFAAGTTPTVSQIKSGSAGANTNRVNGLNLKLSHVSVGGIELVGGANTVTIVGGKVTGAITMNGKTETTSGSTTNVRYNAQRLTFNDENSSTDRNYTTELTSQCSKIEITGDSSSLALYNAKGSTSSGSTAPAVSYEGNGGTITVNGTTNVGKLTNKTRVVESDANKNVTPASVTVKGGTLGGIEWPDTDKTTGRATVTVSNAQVTDSITMKGDSTVTINAGTTGGAAITVPQGTLSINGTVSAPTVVGDIKIGTAGVKAALNVSGTKVVGGKITSESGSNLTLNIPKTGSPADHAYIFDELDLGSYTGRGIKGGTFKTKVMDGTSKLWMDADLTFGVNLYTKTENSTSTQYWTYYGSKELNQAFSDLGQAKAGAKAADVGDATVFLAGQNLAALIKLYNGNTQWAAIAYGNGSSSFLLPTMMFGTPVAEWVHKGTATIVKDNILTTPNTATALELTNKNGVEIATGVRQVESSPKGVKATLVGNVITLSGAVKDGGNGIASIWVELETNIKKQNDAQSEPETAKVTVEVAYNIKTKATYFVTAYNVAASDLGIKVEENRLTMNDGLVVYTVNGSGLSVPAANLNIHDNSKTGAAVEVSVSKSGVTGDQKNELAAQLKKNASFKWENAYAVWEGVNAALKTYGSESAVTGWINNAQTVIWQRGLKDAKGNWVKLSNNVELTPHSGPYSATDKADGSAIAEAFSEAYLVPYLQVNVTDFTSDYSTITATLVPSYRIVVSKGDNVKTDAAYVVQAGRSLGTLTGSMTGGATVTLGLEGKITYAHQDSTYGYAVTNNALVVNHVGARDGLGTFVFNNTKPLIELNPKGSVTTTTKATTTVVNPYDGALSYYDALQAAVDDTQPRKQGSEDKITVDGAYKGSYSITVSGLARTFMVKVLGEKRLEVPSSSLIKSTVSAGDDGNTWTVQLLEDTVKAVTGNITIAEATGGKAAVSSNPAAEGQTVTITLTPDTGYRSNGVTVRTAAGTAVAVNGSGNAYTFVMPATSVTVTPAFVTGSGTAAPSAASVVVSGNTMGSATTTAMNGQVTGGSVVGVTTYPNAGYRTMSVNVTTNGGGAAATRTGDNSFSFTVPVNATAVTVTPVYDVDNGTRFSDVWSNEYYSAPVSWAVSKGIIGGMSTYSFGPGYNCKRGDMMVMLYRAAGSPSVANVRNPFVDISPSDYYYNAVLWAYSKGITGGVDSTHFGPGQSVTRAQTVTFLYRYAGQPAVGTSNGFYDVSSKDYYAKAVTWAVNQGITNGKTLNSFAPGSSCLRAEIATFLYRDFTGTRA